MCKKCKKTQSKLTANSWLSIQNINNWQLWIRKKNVLLNLISHQQEIDKTFLYGKYPYKGEYQLFINKSKSLVQG